MHIMSNEIQNMSSSGHHALGYRTPRKCTNNKQSSDSHASFRLHIIPFAFEKDIFQDVTQGQYTDQTIVFVDNYQPVNSRLSDCVKEGVETIIDGARKDSGEILSGESIKPLHLRNQITDIRAFLKSLPHV